MTGKAKLLWRIINSKAPKAQRLLALYKARYGIPAEGSGPYLWERDVFGNDAR